MKTFRIKTEIETVKEALANKNVAYALVRRELLALIYERTEEIKKELDGVNPYFVAMGTLSYKVKQLEALCRLYIEDFSGENLYVKDGDNNETNE